MRQRPRSPRHRRPGFRVQSGSITADDRDARSRSGRKRGVSRPPRKAAARAAPFRPTRQRRQRRPTRSQSLAKHQRQRGGGRRLLLGESTSGANLLDCDVAASKPVPLHVQMLHVASATPGRRRLLLRLGKRPSRARRLRRCWVSSNATTPTPTRFTPAMPCKAAAPARWDPSTDAIQAEIAGPVRIRVGAGRNLWMKRGARADGALRDRHRVDVCRWW